MDLDTLIPIILTVVYILSRVFKAKPKQGVPKRPGQAGQARTPGQSTQSMPPKRKKAFSFEDILQEFEKSLAGEEVQEERPTPAEEIEYKKRRPVEIQPETRPTKYETYEGTTYETPDVLNKELMEKDLFARSEQYAVKQGQEEENEFVKMLKEPDGARKAIVLSEIINRKYF